VALFSERKRLQNLRDREEAGESFWTEDFSPEVRMKVKFALADCCNTEQITVADYAHGLIIRDSGVQRLTTASTGPVSDLFGALAIGDNDMVATVIESLYVAMELHWGGSGSMVAGPSTFEAKVK
jgi:hypothetical protein